MKILVTGGAGYIGSFMVRKLKNEGYDTVILDNLSQGHQASVIGFRLENVDLVTEKERLTDLLKEEKFEGIIHMASYIQMGESYANPGKYYKNNVVGFLNLLEAMVETNTNNIILSSTAGVYGNPATLPIVEESPKNPLNPYGKTKDIMEEMLKDYNQARGISFISIRYFNAAGGALDGSIGEDHPMESHLIPNVIKAVLKNEEVEIFGNDYKTKDGTCVRDYIHVLDLVDNHLLALQSLFNGKRSEFYNAGIGKGYSNKEVIEMIKKVSGVEVKVKYGPRRMGDADTLYAANEKIKKDLGWEPKYDLQKIVETAYLWHKNHPKGYGDL